MSEFRSKTTAHRHAFLLAGALAFAFGCGGDGGGGMGGGVDGGGGGGGGGADGGGGGGGGGDTDGGGGGGGGGSNIEWPATPGDYAADLATYLNVLTIPEPGTCCKDFGDKSKNGAGEVDNGLAQLADDVNPPADLQAEIDASIMAGDLVLLLDHRELDGDPDDFVMAQFVGAFANGTTFEDADAGEGEFTINPASFADGTGEPQVYFDPANIDGGTVTAGPDQMSIDFPLQGAVLSLVIHEAEVGGDATVGSSAVTYEGGTLSGYITLEDFFGAINALLNSSQCSCLEKDGDVYTEGADGWESSCGDASACDGPGEDVCVALGSDDVIGGDYTCTFLPGFVNGAADIDLNNNHDDPYEALSVGLQWTGVEASVTGVTQ